MYAGADRLRAPRPHLGEIPLLTLLLRADRYPLRDPLYRREVHVCRSPALEGPLHFARNNYDKVGHFAQGAFPAIIAREIILRTRAARSKAWAAFFSITVCLSIAALYEIFEWATAEIIHEEADAFLGTQGDPWDTQKDMAWCLVGAVFSMLFLTGIHDRSIRRLVSRRNE